MKMNNYLDEHNLGEFLMKYLPATDWKNNKKFLSYKIRPDWQSTERKLIIEFDGFLHYTRSSVILKDLEKDTIYKENQYSVVRIPFFIQLDIRTIKFLFGIDVNIKNAYQNGFVSTKISDVMPCDFCELGIIRFKNDLKKFDFIADEIMSSLTKRIKNNDKRSILPPSMFN